MTFTYAGNLNVDRDFVRFWVGDTVEDESYLSDQVIDSLLSTQGSKQKATIAACRYIQTRLSQPSFRADWLQISYSDARKGFAALQRELEAQFGLTDDTLAGGEVNMSRSDTVDRTGTWSARKR